MALRSTLILLLLVVILALVSQSSAGPAGFMNLGMTRFSGSKCSGLVSDCVDSDEEMGMESESSRRSLAQGGNYISYGALQKDRVPCGQRGASYYNCNQRNGVNPYRRGCSAITRCARKLN